MMAMKKREKILGIVVAALLVVLLGNLVFSTGPTESTSDLRQSHRELQAAIAGKQKRIDELLHPKTTAKKGGKSVTEKLAEWNRRSLPANPEIARPLYEKWLVGLVEEVGLEGAKFDPGETRERAGVYTSIPVSIRGRASADQLLEFLYKFYSTGHLHKIRLLSIQPVEGSGQFDVKIAIEALSLTTADQTDRLGTDLESRLERGSLQDYIQAFRRRGSEEERFESPYGFFAAYVRPPGAPSSVSVKATSDSVSLSWKGGESSGVEYDVSRSVGDDDHFVKVTDRPLSGPSYRDTDVECDTKYAYRVRAVDRFERRSEDSGTVHATPRKPEPPPKPAPPKEKPGFDPTKFAFVTAILEVAGRPQVWIVVRTLGETLKLHEGDPFAIGRVEGKVARIGVRSVEIEIDGRRCAVELGGNIHEAFNE